MYVLNFPNDKFPRVRTIICKQNLTIHHGPTMAIAPADRTLEKDQILGKTMRA